MSTPSGRPSVLAFIVLVVAMLTDHAAAQPSGDTRATAIGVSPQAYPAGVILAARASFAIRRSSALTAYAAYNITDRRDFGEHDNEEGGGPGFGLGVRTYLTERYRGFLFGIRTDVWFLDIDWDDDAGPRSGNTDVIVLQPTAHAGYSGTVANGRLVLEATISLGLEVNARTRGEAVGEGVILLGGIGVAYRL